MPNATTDPRPAPADSASVGPGPQEVGDLTYEQARDELVSVVARLEAGAESLEDSLTLWERGEALAGRCQEWLDGARERLAAVREPVRDVGTKADTHDEGDER
ncbi:exodeoxyribonuclease VII small subunit [Cellulomonas sp. URHB0016]